MILTGHEIRHQVELGNIVIEDFNEAQLGPNSYNLRLGDELLVYKEAILDPRKDMKTAVVKIPEEGLVLMPGGLYLAKTQEYTETHGFVPQVVGRSSIGRLGLWIHVTAGFGDLGFKGNWTLELACVQPVRVYPGMQICQTFYQTVYGNAADEYHGKYQGSRDVVKSRIYQELGENGEEAQQPRVLDPADDWIPRFAEEIGYTPCNDAMSLNFRINQYPQDLAKGIDYGPYGGRR